MLIKMCRYLLCTKSTDCCYIKQIIQRRWHPTPALLPGKSHGRRSLVGCSPWSYEESDTTEWLPFYFSLSCIGEGNGNPLQCSCLENPRDGGAWWAAIYGVAQGRTLKWLSNSKACHQIFRICLWPYSFKPLTTPILKLKWALNIIC